MALGTPASILRETLSSSNDPQTTGSFTVTDGADVFAAVAEAQVDTAASGMSMSGGVGAGTLVAQQISDFLGKYLTVYRWHNVSSGTYTIDIDWSGAAPFRDIGIAVNEITGVDGTTPVDGIQSDAVDSASSMSLSITSETGDVVMSFIFSGSDPTHGDTALGTDQQLGTTGEYIGASYAAGATSVTMDHANLTNQSIQVAFNINDGGGGGGSVVPIIMAHHG